MQSILRLFALSLVVTGAVASTYISSASAKPTIGHTANAAPTPARTPELVTSAAPTPAKTPDAR